MAGGSLSDVFGAPVAASTLVSWVRQVAAQITEKVLPGIVDRIAASPGAAHLPRSARSEASTQGRTVPFGGGKVYGQ